MKQKIVLLGAPGSGKGTQAKVLAEKLEYRHISTGDILRDALKNGTPVGLQAKSYMEKGELVPDEVMATILLDALKEDDAKKGFILDGFPRTVNQARILEKGLSDNDGSIDLAIELIASRELIVERLTQRRICKDCGAVYNLKNIPPKTEGICDSCAGPLYQRNDDKEETIDRRLQIYQQQVQGLLEFFKEKGVLESVDGGLPREETLNMMLALIRA
ncbi:MAG: adenylate kinase [Chlamydiota bacterium]|nr:adenylate kinase [Chlamydiota bacterium]